MTIYLVTASDYDYALIDSAWASEQEALDRIAHVRTLKDGDEGYVPYAYNFQVTVMELGEVRGGMDRYKL